MPVTDERFFQAFDQEHLEIKSIAINISLNEIKIVTHGLIIMQGIPNETELLKSNQHLLVFNGVSYSSKKFFEYDNLVPSGYKQAQGYVDGPFNTTQDVYQSYLVSGVLKDPYGWLEWEIHATSWEISAI